MIPVVELVFVWRKTGGKFEEWLCRIKKTHCCLHMGMVHVHGGCGCDASQPLTLSLHISDEDQDGPLRTLQHL
jgi:hypothetical protein